MNITTIRSNSPYAAKCIAWFVCIAFLSACSPTYTTTGPPPSPKEVNIIYTGNCATDVDPATPIHIVRGQKIHWQSVEISDGSTVDIAKDYQIIFDPFVGRPIPSNRNTGFAHSAPAGDNKPYVEYKYTIDTEGCNTPLDPRIIVQP